MPAEVARLISQVAYASPRDHALFLFFVDTGARAVGVASLRLSKLDLDDGVAILLEKGSHYVEVYFGDETTAALKRWLRARPRADHDYVFTAYRRTAPPLKVESIKDVIRRLSKRACGQGYGTHSLRHLVAQTWVEAGEPPNNVQHKLGHRHIRTTIERYYPQHNRDVQQVSKRLSLSALAQPIGVSPKFDHPKIIPLDDY